MSGLTIYSTSWCGYCHRLMSQLDRQGIAYDSINIENDPEAAQFVQQANGGNQTVPTVKLPNGNVLTNPSVAELLSQL